jgi:hypothetical protein
MFQYNYSSFGFPDSRKERDISGRTVLHLYDSFYQQCSKLDSLTTLGLKNK